MTAQQSATEAQCPTAQQSVSSTAQQITTYTKLPNRVCPKAFVQHKSNFKSKSNTICPTLKSPPRIVRPPLVGGFSPLSDDKGTDSSIC